ncbi:MAG TPA: T9SS type A sorting domain-containing protein [Flavisolibacter sp.]|nr:T9SS type A sorting domain-containing protein [Flavisolibacter sp.]
MKRNLLLICCVMIMYGFTISHKSPAAAGSSNLSDSLVLKKKPGSRKNSIKIYPNPSYGRLSVSATTTATLHFYIFDLEGTLIYQAKLNNKDKKTIDNLPKGTYLYDVFEQDECIEEGKIIIK